MQETHISKGLNEIEHIVVIAQYGSLTIEAVKWLIKTPKGMDVPITAIFQYEQE